MLRRRPLARPMTRRCPQAPSILRHRRPAQPTVFGPVRPTAVLPTAVRRLEAPVPVALPEAGTYEHCYKAPCRGGEAGAVG